MLDRHELRRWAALLGLLTLNACDECAGLSGEKQAQCCVKASRTPSCSAADLEVPECGQEARDIGSACVLQDGRVVEFALDPSKPELQDRFFSIDTCLACRSLSIALTPAPTSDENGKPGVLSVQVLSPRREAVAAFTVSDESVHSHLVGVTGSGTYFIRVHSDSGDKTTYRLGAAGETALVEVEPNDSIEAATPLGLGADVTGDHNGVDPTKSDIDFFELKSTGVDGSLAVTASRSEPVGGDATVTVAVLDALGRPLAPERPLGDDLLVLEVGVEAAASYFVAVTSPATTLEPHQGYRLLLGATPDMFDKEPNDTAPNAQLLLPKARVRGGYSGTGDQIDDDVFRVPVPAGSKHVDVDVVVDAQCPSGVSFDVAILDESEAPIATGTFSTSDPPRLGATLGTGAFVLVRARSSASFAECQYALTTTFSARLP
jgi:hypothetical protein